MGKRQLPDGLFARFVRALCLALLLSALNAGNSGAGAAELVTFKVGEASPANTFLAIWMAEAAGFYRAQGLKLEIVPMVGGRESGPELKAGKIQLMHIGMSSVVRANLAGGNLRTIGSLSNVIRQTMFTAPGIKSAADLKGGIVGISSAGSESDSATTLALKRLGLTRQDVMVKEIGVDRFAAVRDRQVAATMLGEPTRSEAFAAGLNPIVDLYAEHIPWLFSGLTVDRAYLNGHRDLLARFLKATIEGNYLAISEERRAKAVLAKELKLSDPKIIDLSYANFKAETPLNAEIDRTGAENILSAVAPRNASNNVDDYVDTGISAELRREGFFDAMRRKYGIREKTP
jgi:NitT/TauT family transport system substrate-binding protein